MRRILFTLIVALCATTFGFAQEQQATEKSYLVQPMFGNHTKTDAQQKKDERFLTSCDKSFLNRQEASQFFMQRGWEYFNEGQVDTAMYRFNLAWLLNPNDKEPYWAFGLITASQGKNMEALGYYEKAKALDPKNSTLLSDMAAAYISEYKNSKKKKNLKKAKALLDEAIAADTANAFALFNYAVIKYQEKKYADAWDYLHKSRNIDLTAMDYGFLTELVAKMPDPQGFFNSSDAAVQQ